MKFFKGFLVFFLLVIIVGGLGYIGYNFLYLNHSNQSHKDSAQNAGSQPTGNTVGLNQSNIILQNKESLNKSVTTLNEAIRLMTVDPYAPNSNPNGMGNMQIEDNKKASTAPAAQGNTQSGTATAPAQGGNTTNIHIYPQVGTDPSGAADTSKQSNMTMQNMGPVYDANKMEQLHQGLYKMSLGMALLNQLQNQLSSQAENAAANTQDLVQYYTNQYNLTVQTKSKLTEALNLINEAASLVNINPYVSSNGLIYDKERMNQIHQSVFKLAEGAASLNLLNDDLLRQSINLSNTVQTYSMSNASRADQVSHTAMQQGLFGGWFDNIDIRTVANVILIIFVIGFVLSILGFIFSQLKPKTHGEQ
ncbi:MAG: hypothetical protein N2645_06660 [Clostridia bacterium]|nr:hypothetical protein [Clostridia bacterium]